MPWNLIGHAWAVSLLCRHLKAEEVRHAYLITGADGIGKRTLAWRFARALTCLSPTGDDVACGECRVCRRVSAEGHPDVHVLARLEGKSEIGIDQVRELQRQLSLSPLEARRRVALIVDFHEASDEASNALLKTLEEPAGQVALLMTALTAESVLPTIASRCEIIALRPVASDEIESGLRAAGAEAERARLLSGLASGRPGWALAALASPPTLQARQQALEELRALLAGSRAERFAFAEKIYQDDDRLIAALEAWLTLWRDVLVVACGADARITNLDRRSLVDSLAAEVGPGQARLAALAVERTLSGLARHANPRLAFETLLLDLPRVRPG